MRGSPAREGGGGDVGRNSSGHACSIKATAEAAATAATVAVSGAIAAAAAAAAEATAGSVPQAGAGVGVGVARTVPSTLPVDNGSGSSDGIGLQRQPSPLVGDLQGTVDGSSQAAVVAEVAAPRGEADAAAAGGASLPSSTTACAAAAAAASASVATNAVDAPFERPPQASVRGEVQEQQLPGILGNATGVAVEGTGLTAQPQAHATASSVVDVGGGEGTAHALPIVPAPATDSGS